MLSKRQRTGENDGKNGTYPDPPCTPFPHFGTDAIHAGQDPEQWASNAVVPLISLSTTFKQESPGVMPGVRSLTFHNFLFTINLK